MIDEMHMRRIEGGRNPRFPATIRSVAARPWGREEDGPVNLADARALKRSLTQALVKRVARRISARALDLPAGPLVGAKKTPPSLALGVARAGRNDFKLAVRIQQRSRTVDEILDAIRKRAAGETDERYVGPLRKLATPWHRKRRRPMP